MKTVGFMTLGCKTNQYDSQAMLEAFEKEGYVRGDFSKPCDVYVVNSCVVTGMGEKKSMKYVRQAIRRNPGAQVVVAGCMAQQRGEGLFLPGVRLVIGNQRRGEVARLLREAVERDVALCAVDDLSEGGFEAMDVEAIEGRSRAVIKIQEGCDNRCSYCIIPSVRGPARSRPLESIRGQALRLGRKGYLELVVTGIHLSSYGKDLGDETELLDALLAIEEAPGVERIRLGSLEPGYITLERAERLRGITKLCPQFHLSLQSGSDHVLGLMRRKYSTKEFERAVALLRDAFPGCAVTTDVICGFPGETKEMFEETVAFSRRIGFSRMHIFPYSEREGTPAARFEGVVPVKEREERTLLLIGRAQEMEEAYAASFVGKEVELLLEDGLEGFTKEYVRCRVCQGETGEVCRAKVKETNGALLIAD